MQVVESLAAGERRGLKLTEATEPAAVKKGLEASLKRSLVATDPRDALNIAVRWTSPWRPTRNGDEFTVLIDPASLPSTGFYSLVVRLR